MSIRNGSSHGTLPAGNNVGEKRDSVSRNNCLNLDSYNLKVNQIRTSCNYQGPQPDLEIEMYLRSMSWDTGTNNMQKFEEFLKDVKILNNLKKSNHPGVVDQWEKIQTLLALTAEEDK